MKVHLILLLLVSTTAFAKIETDTILLQRIEKLEAENEILQNQISTKFDNSEKNVNLTYDGISTQITASSYSLGIFGLLLTLGGIGLGFYISYISRKVSTMNREGKEVLEMNQKIRKDIESDMQALYSKLHREETVHILNRLEKVPRDIANFAEQLLSRELQETDFIRLKRAFFKVKDNSDPQYAYSYIQLIFQNFAGQGIRDVDIRFEFKSRLYHCIGPCFENDILKSSYDFFKTMVDLGLHNFREEINIYFHGLNCENHKNFIPVYKEIFGILQSRTNRFDLFNLIETTDNTRWTKISYGEMLKDEYKNETLSVSEQLTFEDLEKIKIEEDARLTALSLPKFFYPDPPK